MTHELKHIIKAYREARDQGLRCVLATVTALTGSSYRRPGVRMLLREDGIMIGAVSGGCVEKEVKRQAERVFAEGVPRMMTYDGRYRLGCEGILYILLEPMALSDSFLNEFDQLIQSRMPFALSSYFRKEDGPYGELGSMLIGRGGNYSFREGFKAPEGLSCFEQPLPPCFRLIVIGAEHDAVQLTAYAALTGWEVTVVAPPYEEKTLSDFPGADRFWSLEPEAFPNQELDDQTALVLMNHSFARDMAYLLRLNGTAPAYLGLLGPADRREKLLAACLERHPDMDIDFVENIHGPAGLDIGSETPQEIALAIVSEILAVVRRRHAVSLRDRTGAIHER